MLFDSSRTGRSRGGGRVEAGGLKGSENGGGSGFVVVVVVVVEVEDVDAGRYRREAEAMRELGDLWIRLELGFRRSGIAEMEEARL